MLNMLIKMSKGKQTFWITCEECATTENHLFHSEQVQKMISNTLLSVSMSGILVLIDSL